MSNQDKATALKVEIGKMFIAAGKEAEREVIEVYLEYLRDYAVQNDITFEVMFAAIKKTAIELDYPPKVHDIIKRIEPSEEEENAELNSLAYSESQKALNDLMFSTSGPTTKDHLALTVLSQVGFYSWKDKPMEETTSKFIPIFISTYKQLYKAKNSSNDMLYLDAIGKEERRQKYLDNENLDDDEEGGLIDA